MVNVLDRLEQVRQAVEHLERDYGNSLKDRPFAEQGLMKGTGEDSAACASQESVEVSKLVLENQRLQRLCDNRQVLIDDLTKRCEVRSIQVHQLSSNVNMLGKENGDLERKILILTKTLTDIQDLLGKSEIPMMGWKP